MPKRINRNIRITCRLTPEEYTALKIITESGVFGSSISRVIRNILKLRINFIKDLIQSQKATHDGIGDEISEMFRNYEDDGYDISWPSDINGRL